MKKSKISILLLLLVMILSISAVSAADIDDNSDVAVQAVDEASIASVDVDEIASTDNADVLAAAGDGNFTELQNSVDSSGTVIMSKDYTRVDGENTISISRDVTILGNNHKIDGNNLGGIFNVNSGYTLTLMGLTLINGNAENGGAVYNNGGSLTIVNANFLNNTATKSGGAIYNDGGSLTITGSTFDGNDLTDRSVNGYGGAAIYTKNGDVLISSSTISNNLKDIVHRGGTGAYTGDLSSAAVTNKNGALTVTDSTFESNSGSYGGAILSDGSSSNLIVSGSTFNNNFAFNGGAIYCPDGNYYISESNFTGNKVRGTGSSNSNYAHGGAIAATESDECIISDCIFKDNSAAMGGAISTTNTQVVGCTFINNTAQSAYSETFNGKTNNRGGYGAAIYSDALMTIDDSTFINNTNTRNENVCLRNATVTNSVFVNTIINANKGPLTISNNTYDNAGKDIAGGNSPIIYFDGVGDIPYVTSGKVYLDASSFADLQAMIDSGSTGGIYLTGDIAKLDSEYETFANGIYINRSVSIYLEGHTITSDNGKVFNVDSTGSLSLYNGEVVADGTAAITNDGTVTVGLTTNFTNVDDYAIENNGRVSQSSLTTFTQLSNLIALVSGGEVYIGSSKITKADDEKEAFADGIVVEKDLTITGYYNTYYKRIDTQIDADGSGRIFAVNDGATLTLNKMILKNGYAEKGGAVYVEAANNFVAQTVNFINNTAVYRGGAIYSECFVNVTNCVFDSNDITFRTANDDNGGAAIYNLRGILLIKDTNITNNLKDIVIRDGNNGDLLNGVVVTSGETIIDNAYFANNTGSWGAAISSCGKLNPDDYVLSVLNSKFEGNNATFGGAIFVEYSNLDVRNCTFENNRGVGVGSSGTSNTQGGAIVIFPGDSHAEIIDSTFIGNSANLGGAVSFPGVDSDTYVDNCTFIDNSANNGGAVFFWSEEGSLAVSNSDFIGNDASGWGGAIYSSDNASMIITESNFEGNTASAATIVTFGSSSIDIDGCNFTENANTYDWGVITVYGTGDANIKNSEFINDVTGAIAIDVEDNANVNVEDTKISTTNNYGIWAGDGNLSLENNEIESAYVPVKTSGEAEIVSIVRANISENKTYNRHLGEITVTINLTDDNDNVVYDANLRFVVYKDGEVVFNESASFDGEKYTGTFTPTKPGTYLVTLDYPAQDVATAIYVVSSSLTDLKNKIDNAETLIITLDMDYAYIAEFDEGLEDGIVIDKNIIIDGNGSTISGANLARLFNVTSGYTLVLGNLTVCDAKADKGAGIYVNEGAGLLADKVNFINNTAVYRGGAIYSEGTVVVANSVFDSNDITFRTANDDNGGAAIYNLNGKLSVYTSNITNNLKDIVIRDGNKGDLLDGVVVTSGETIIEDTYFANNTGSWGGAISSLGYMNDNSYKLTVKNSTFEGNNATFGGAIFVQSSELVVDGCTFENNRGVGEGSSGTSNTQGGAIVVFPSGAQATITDSKFISNVARVGGAVSFAGVDGDSLIDNCTFVDNLADDGGAFYFWSGSATITVTDSDFINNAAAYGGAIENEGDSDLIVDNCTFVENYATTSGGAIISAANTSVSNSVFENNEAPSSTNAIYVWYPDSTLTLSNNTIIGDAVQIYTRPGVEIVNQLNATFLNNQTIYVEQGETFTLNATLTDEKGNFIYDADFRFSVNGETIDEIFFDADTGLYSVDYYIGTAGPKEISTNYEATGLTKYTGILDVPKANVTEFYVGTGTATKIPYGENVTIFVGLYGVNSEGLNKTIKVVVNNTEYTVPLINGEGSFNVSGLDPNEYVAFAIFEGDENYNGAYANGFFNVLYPDPILSVVTQDITYGEEAILTISLTEADGTPLQGTLTIMVNDFVKMLYWNGENSIVIPNLGANETGWNVFVSYEGDDYHVNVWNDTEFIKVAKATPTVDITGPSDINIGENAEFTATVDAKVDGIALNIWVDGVGYISMGPGEWDSNVAKFMITSDWLPEARDYNITVQFIGNENYTASENVSQILTVNKIDVGNVIQISGSTVTYGENATVTVELPMDAEGNVTVTIPGVGTFNETVEGGIAIVEIPGLGVDLYELFAVDYSGDNKYASHKGMATVEVKQAKSSVEIKPIAEVTYGNNVTIGYTVLNATTIKINVAYGGLVPVYYVTFDANVSKYDGSLVLPNLAAGEYFVVVENDGNDNYTFSAAPAEFTVNKAEPTMQTEISPNIKAGDANVVVQVVLPENATGKVMLLIDGEPTNQMGYDLINGTVNITVPADFVNAGKRSYYVIYDGDDNYTSAYNLKSFEVSKVDPMVVIAVIPDAVTKEPVNVSIFVGNVSGGLTVARATGQILIEGYGVARLVTLEDGIGNLELIDIVPGDYEITVTYLGDDNFNNATNSTKFTVPKRAATVEIADVTANILGGQNATFTVNMDPDSASGNVTIYIDNNEYATVVLDGEYANATVSIPDLGEGEHKIGVKYNGNDHYNASEVVNTTVTVDKAGSKVTIDPIANVTFGHTVEISYTVENETTVTYSVVNESGVEQTYQIKDGKLVLSGLSVGNYTVTIKNAENNMFTGDSATAKFTVSEKPTFDFNVNFPENSTDTVFSISVPEDAGGYLLVDIDGQHYYAPVENGTASISIPGLAPGNYTATVSYTGDDKYVNASTTKEVSVPSNLPEDAITVPETADADSPATYAINLPSDATGYLEVDVDGTKYIAALNNGSASITLPALSEGEHNVTVKYSGDSKYSSVSKDTKLNVPVYGITENKNVSAVYSANAYYKVLVTKDGKAVGAGENVTIKYNGKTYTVKTDSNGYATLKLNTKVKVKSYTITAEYKGVKVTNKVSIKHVVKAYNKNVKKSKTVTRIKVGLKKVNGKILKGKVLKVKFRGKIYKVKTNKKGVAIWKVKKSMVSKLKVGKKYRYRVTYGKDYLTKKITIRA